MPPTALTEAIFVADDAFRERQPSDKLYQRDSQVNVSTENSVASQSFGKDSF
jgi:hypothetical protein